MIAPPARPATARRLLVSVAATVVLLAALAEGSASAAKPKPAFSSSSPHGLAVLISADQLQAGGGGILAIHAPKRAACALSFSGPGGLAAGPFRVKMRRAYATWTWQVADGTAPGAWTAKVACTRHRKRTAKTVPIAVSSDVPGATGSVVQQGTMRVAVSKTPPGALVGGARKGGGGYPDDGALCEWTGLRNGDCKNSRTGSMYDWGYRSSKGSWSLLSSRGFNYRNCTDFVAWFMGLKWSDFKFTRGRGNAADFKAFAGNAGLQVTTTASVGDIAWWGSERAGGFGHVAIVQAVGANGTVSTVDYNGDGRGNYTTRANLRADGYLHRPAVGPQPSDYAGHIVQWDGDHKGQKTAWLVGADLKRRWIPTIEVYQCLKDQGAPGPDVLPGSMLDRLPDQTDVLATCNPANKGGPEPPPIVPGAPPPPVRVNSYDNYASAGVAGRAMCRGNPADATSMPGGSATETFVVPAGVASIDSALVQIDPDSRVNAHANLFVNGALRASADAAAAGDTRFAFPSVPVTGGATVALTISFTASFGKIITVYTVGAPGGTFTASNSCPAGAPNVSTSSTGLRAVISGWSG
jgi:surface antigen